jgi:hypothetical protein
VAISNWLVCHALMLSLQYTSVAGLLRISFILVTQLQCLNKFMSIVWSLLKVMKCGLYLRSKGHKLQDMLRCQVGLRKMLEKEKKLKNPSLPQK